MLRQAVLSCHAAVEAYRYFVNRISSGRKKNKAKSNGHLELREPASVGDMPEQSNGFSAHKSHTFGQVGTEIFCGDCLNVLQQFPENKFDLIVTSPPYVDQRKSTYGGIRPEKYVEWFLERSQQFLRVLKPTGSFVLNIKERVHEGERHVYVLELILALRRQGWLWTEEYIWHKRNCHPGRWPNRFRDAWERCLHFTKEHRFKMFQDQVKVPMGAWAKTRLKKLGKNDVVRFNSQVGSGFGKNIANWIGREMAFPDNVLHFATECGNKKHSAAFPEALPEWFIKLFTQDNDWVLDPFAGSGTTNVVSCRLGRNSVGIDCLQQYAHLAEKNLEELAKTSPRKVSRKRVQNNFSDEQLTLGAIN